MREPLDRRSFMLKSVGASLALPGLPSLMAGSKTVQAAVKATSGADDSCTPRFVAVGNLLGFQTKQLFPETVGKDYETTRLLKPLAAMRDQMTLYRGLDHGIKGGHFAVHSFLSGVLNSEAQNRADGNVSIDQFMADEVGMQTRFSSLTVGSEGGIHGGCQIAWTKSGVRVPPITGPADLFERLFISDSKERQAERVKENRLQDSILDSVLEDANRLSKRVNHEDKNKLDEYFSSIRDVEKRLELRKQWASHPKPEKPFDRPADQNTVEDLPMLYELIALALQDRFHSDRHLGNRRELSSAESGDRQILSRPFSPRKRRGRDRSSHHIGKLSDRAFRQIPEPSFRYSRRRANPTRLDLRSFRQRDGQRAFA